MADKTASEIKKGKLVGYAYYTFNNKPQHDRENDKYLYKVDLRLTEEDGSPIVVTDKVSGKQINMLEKAKELGLIIKKPNNTIEGEYVRIKREVKDKVDKEGNKFKTPAPETKTRTGEDFSDIIGNESKVEVHFGAIPIKQGAYKANCSAYLHKIVVIKHVPYVGKMEDEQEFDYGDSKPVVQKKAPVKAEAPFDDEEEEYED